MTGKVELPPLPRRAHTAVSAPPIGPEPQGGEFAALVERFRTAPPAVADFMGQLDLSRDDLAAKPFNADGFFSRLEARLAERLHRTASGTAIGEVPSGALPTLLLADASMGALGARPDRPRSEATTPSRLQPMHRREGSTVSSPASLVPAAQPPTIGAPSFRSDGRQLGPTQRETSRSAYSADRPATEAFKLWLDGASICIAGPQRALSPDDEAELLERVAELLAGHGLRLSDIRFNGRPLAPGAQGV